MKKYILPIILLFALLTTVAYADLVIPPNAQTVLSTSSSVTDGNLAVFDGTSGTLIKDGGSAASGATTALDNLASVQINTSLLSDTADTDSLGTTAAEWLNLFIGDAGKIFLGLGQDASIERNAANEMTLTATSGVTVEGVKMDGGVVTGASSITSTTFVGDLTGNADTVTTNANLTGHITSSGNATILGSFTTAQLSTALSDGTVATSDSTNTFTNKTFDANGTGNSLSNVDVVDLADGTDGELITWDANGNPTTVAVGTITQVLTSNGVGEAPTFEAVAGGGDVSKVGTPVDNQIGVWTGDGTIEGTTGLTYNGSNFLLTGDIGATGTRITKGWFADLQVTNAIAGSITGNAATVTTIAGLAPDTATTQATQSAITSLGTLTSLATGTITETTNAIGTAQTVGFTVVNTTAAAAGAQQYSPVFELEGQGWKTDATAETQEVKWGIQTRPVQGTANPTSVLDFLSSINGGAYAAKATLTSAGVFTATNFIGALTGNADTVTGFTPASGSLTLAGADALTITTTGTTNSTLPLGTKTLVATDVATLSSLASIGTITTGVWTGTDIAVLDGGTGAGTFTDHGVMLGSGTGALSVTATGSSGEVLTSNGSGADPTFQAAGGGGWTLDSTVSWSSENTTKNVSMTGGSDVEFMLVMELSGGAGEFFAIYFNNVSTGGFYDYIDNDGTVNSGVNTISYESAASEYVAYIFIKGTTIGAASVHGISWEFERAGLLSSAGPDPHHGVFNRTSSTDLATVYFDPNQTISGTVKVYSKTFRDS